MQCVPIFAIFGFCLISLVHCTGVPTIVEIQVGGTAQLEGGIFQFNPANITAANGTVVNFIFNGIPGNHSITQSSFDTPCLPLPGGFDSGNVIIIKEPAETPRFDVEITDDRQAIYFYCAQTTPFPHCVSGMVGSINAPLLGNTYEKFQQNAESIGTDPSKVGQGQGGLGGSGAIALGAVLPQPGITIYGGPLFTGVSDPLATLTNGAGVSTSSSTTSSNTVSTAHQGTASDINRGPQSGSKLSVGVIIAISLGVVLSILSISVGLWYAQRHVSSKHEKRISQEMVDAPFEMESFPSDVERHRTTEFMAREKRDIQLPPGPPPRLPPTKFLNRHPPLTTLPRRDNSAIASPGVYVRLHEDGGPALPSFPDQTEHSVIDVPPTYSTIGRTLFT